MIGYGTDDNGIEYYLCANSWGTTFGLDGYFKMAVNDAASEMNVAVGCTAEVSSDRSFLF